MSKLFCLLCGAHIGYDSCCKEDDYLFLVQFPRVYFSLGGLEDWQGYPNWAVVEFEGEFQSLLPNWILG